MDPVALQGIVIVVAIAISVFLGYKTKINTGFFCIAFAYAIGCFWMGMKTKDLISNWPTSTMFVILAVSLFYNVAAANGTLEKISRSLLYACRRFPGLLPYALFFVAVILSVMGAAYFTVLAFLAPITMLICEESKMDKLTGAVAINCGALAGGNFPTAALGVVFRDQMDIAYNKANDAIKAAAEEASEEPALLTAVDSFSSTLILFGLAIVVSLIIITVFRYCFKSNRNIGKGVIFSKPDAYDKKQKITLWLILAMMVVVLIFPVLKMFLPDVAFISDAASKIDVGLVAIVFAVIALLLNLAPQKKIIAAVPWNTILMIAGAGMLIGIAKEPIKLLATWIGESVPVFFIPLAFAVIAAIMSFFSSTTGVVVPTLYPLIPVLAATTGLNPVGLFTCTVLGAQSSAISPFSSGGSLILGSCSNEEDRNTLFNRLLFVAVPISVGICIVYNLLVSLVL